MVYTILLCTLLIMLAAPYKSYGAVLRDKSISLTTYRLITSSAEYAEKSVLDMPFMVVNSAASAATALLIYRNMNTLLAEQSTRFADPFTAGAASSLTLEIFKGASALVGSVIGSLALFKIYSVVRKGFTSDLQQSFNKLEQRVEKLEQQQKEYQDKQKQQQKETIALEKKFDEFNKFLESYTTKSNNCYENVKALLLKQEKLLTPAQDLQKNYDGIVRCNTNAQKALDDLKNSSHKNIQHYRKKHKNFLVNFFSKIGHHDHHHNTDDNEDELTGF